MFFILPLTKSESTLGNYGLWVSTFLVAHILVFLRNGVSSKHRISDCRTLLDGARFAFACLISGRSGIASLSSPSLPELLELELSEIPTF